MAFHRTLLSFVFLVACDPQVSQPRTVRRALRAPTQAPSPTPVVLAPVPPPTPPQPVGELFHVDRAAALGPTKVFVVSHARLWRSDGPRWRELAVGGASIRDVTAAAGSLWVLARGTGANAGHVSILRSTGGDDLALAWDFVTSADHDPRALAMVNDHEFYVGGASPTLLRGRMVGSLQTNTHALAGPVDSLLYMPDSMMAVRYGSGEIVMFRWGEVTAVERQGYLFSFSGARESLMMRRDGTVWRGRVWEEPMESDKLSTSSGVLPVAAATLRDERVVVIDAAHRTRILRESHWFDLELSDVPADIVGMWGARVLTQGLCVMVDRDGAVFELVGMRWERRVAPPTGVVD